jgi:hypothetical protein
MRALAVPACTQMCPVPTTAPRPARKILARPLESSVSLSWTNVPFERNHFTSRLSGSGSPPSAAKAATTSTPPGLAESNQKMACDSFYVDCPSQTA